MRLPVLPSRLSQLPELVILEGSPYVDGYCSPAFIHPREACQPPCPWHAPSDHPLRAAPRNFIAVPAPLVTRTCECNVWHPDVDSLALLRRKGLINVMHHACCALQCCGIEEDE